jgi:NADH-quinone oxidoreductase subunit G
MACPGGCIDGGGQPVSFDTDFKEKRTQGIYNCDKQLQLHKSQENPYIKEIYEKFLGEVGGQKAHELLHTKYYSKKRILNQSIKIRNLVQNKIEVCVCVGTNCFLKGSQDLLKQLIKYVTENKLEDLVGFEGHDEIVDVKATFCFERCDKGPIVRINSRIIEHATFDIVKKALDNEIQKVKELIIQ